MPNGGHNALLAFALSYARLGWPVFPLHTPSLDGHCSCVTPNCDKAGKHPRTLHGFKDATTDPALVRAWWERWPNANIGIATGGRSGLVILDVDLRHGGMESLHQLEKLHGDLPITLTINTGNGYHLYFRHPGSLIKSRANVAGYPGLDFRSDDGYVVGPGSRHANGKTYEFATDPDKVAPAPMPAWLIDLSKIPTSITIASGADASQGDRLSEGQRNDALFRLGCGLRRKGLSETAIAAALCVENRERCDPPLREEEVESIANSIAKYPSSANSANCANLEPSSVEWEPPTPFYEFDLPPFPTEALPERIRGFVEALAIATQTPPDLAAMLALPAIAAACSRKCRIQVKEGYAEPLNIFTVTALPPATRKSSVFAAVTAPLVDYEQEEARRVAPEIGIARTRYEIAEKKLKRAQDQAAKTSEAADSQEAERLAAELSAMRIPSSPRLIADDATPERLSTLLHEQDGRMAVMSPEGGVFDLMAGRYSPNSAPNFEVYLKGHAGDTLRVDRVVRAAEHVERPALTLGLAVQPKVLEGLVARTDFRGRGLLGRFLYSRPRSLVGHRDVDAPPVPAEIRTAYHDCLAWLLQLTPERLPSGDTQEHVLQLQDDARAHLREAERWIEPQLAEFGELGGLQDWAGKWLGAVGRITGLLHLVARMGDAEPWASPVSSDTVQRSLEIGKYLIPHAKAAYAAMGADPAVEDAKHILRWIRHRGRESFSKRDVFEGTKGHFSKVSTLEPGLRVLEEHQFIQQRPSTGTPQPGRPPSPTYDVNPSIHSHNSHNSHNSPDHDNSANTANCASPATAGAATSPMPESAEALNADLISVAGFE